MWSIWSRLNKYHHSTISIFIAFCIVTSVYVYIHNYGLCHHHSCTVRMCHCSCVAVRSLNQRAHIAYAFLNKRQLFHFASAWNSNIQIYLTRKDLPHFSTSDNFFTLQVLGTLTYLARKDLPPPLLPSPLWCTSSTKTGQQKIGQQGY